MLAVLRQTTNKCIIARTKKRRIFVFDFKEKKLKVASNDDKPE